MPSASGHRRVMALLFLLSVPPAVLSLSERDTLIRFYNLAGGSHWKNNAGWKQAAEGADDKEQKPICSWYGVTCTSGNSTDGEKIVTDLILEKNHLSGKVSKHLWDLPFLKKVDLQGNLLFDAGFEGFQTATTKAPIETIIVSENRLTFLTGIDHAPASLVQLHFSSNAFEGPFPEEIYRLKHLKVLRGTYNRGITGTLSTEIGTLFHLRELELSYNSLKGSIPTEIGNLNMLEYMSLDENKVTGPLPPEMNSMVKLQYLSVKNSGAENGMLTGPLPSFPDLGHLRELDLSDNALSGAIPSDFLKNSVVTDKAVSISLAGNQLVGKIPSDLARFDKLQLNVQGNRINGIPNALCHKKKWMEGKVGQYGCDAILCPKGTYTDVGRRESEEGTCEACPNGEEGAPHLGSRDCIGGGVGGGGVSTSSAAGGAASAPDASLSGGGLSAAGKFLILLVAIFVPAVLGIAVAKARKRRAKVELAMVGFPSEDNADAGVDALQGRFPAEVRSSYRDNVETSESMGSGAAGDAEASVERCIV